MLRWWLFAGVTILFVAGAAFYFRRPDPVAELDAIVRDLDYRSTAGRLSGLAWAPAQRSASVARSAITRERNADRKRLVSFAANLRKTDADAEVTAVATLMAGDANAAAERLRALALLNNSATTWNDLAVAELERGEGDVSVLCNALGAIEHALEIDAKMAEALFNRAMILEELSLRGPASQAYVEYLASSDGGSQWAVEARERLRRLSQHATQRQEWRDALPTLEHAAAANEVRTIADAVAASPQEARAWGETEFLADWAIASLGGDSATAVRKLSLARAVGQALRRRGDALLIDAVTAIDEAARSNDRPRLERLSRAHAIYRDSRLTYSRRDAARALAGFRDAFALFDRAGSPMALVAEYYMANAAVDVGDVAAALAAITEVTRRAPPDYRALRAQIDWLRGTLYGLDGFFDDALQSYRSAYERFSELGEVQYATGMLDRIATVFAMLGRTDEAWRLRRETFPVASASGIPQRLELALYSAATDAVRERKWDVAHALLGLVVSVEGGNARLQAEAAAWRALAARRSGMPRSAAADLQRARRITSALASGALRQDAEAELTLVEALLAADQEPARSAALLAQYVHAAEGRPGAHRIPQALHARARSLRTLGRLDEAEADLRRAIDLVEFHRAAIGNSDLRDSFLAFSSDVYDQLADLLDGRGRTIEALAVADRRRARLILDRIDVRDIRPTTPFDATFVTRIADRTALIAYGRFDDRLVTYVCTNRGLQRHESRYTRPTIDALSSKFVDALSRSADEEANTAGRRLYDLLLGPATAALTEVDSLVFVFDAELQQLPLAALPMPDGRFLVERFSTYVAPSLAYFLETNDAGPNGIPNSILAVGNPQFGVNRFPGLERLPAAEDEARRVAGMYGKGVVLTGAEATKRAFLDSLALVDVVHVAAHAVVNPLNARGSRLLLAETSTDDGILTIEEITAMRLRARAVVLAGCDTAVAAPGYGDLRSLAAAFLAAGARTVIGALWTLDDEAAKEFSIILHRELSRGVSPAEAVRDAQMRMLQSPDARLRDPRAWAALQVYGSAR